MLVHGEEHAGSAVGFFVAFGEEDHVAIEARAGAFELDEDGEIGGEHAFVVNGAAAVEVAVFYGRGEGVHGPFGFVNADDVEMSHQEQGARRIGHGAGGKAGDDESAAGRAFKNFRGDAFFGEDGGDIFRGDEFVARRIRGVNAQQALQPAERVLLNLGERRVGGRRILRRCGDGLRLKLMQQINRNAIRTRIGSGMRARAILDFPPESEIQSQSRQTNSYYHAGGCVLGSEARGVF